MSVVVAVDEAEPPNAPGQGTLLQDALGDDLARWVGGRGIGGVVLAGRPWQVRVVDQAGAGHDEPRVRGMGADCVDEVLGSPDIDLADLRRVRGPQDGREVDDRRHALHRGRQGVWIEGDRPRKGSLQRAASCPAARWHGTPGPRRPVGGRRRAPTRPVPPVMRMVMMVFRSRGAWTGCPWPGKAPAWSSPRPSR